MRAVSSAISLAVIFGGIALYAINHPEGPPLTPRASPVAMTQETPPPNPPSVEDIVAAHAPQSEIDFAAVHQAFDDRDAPNSIARDEKLARTSRAWQQAVLGLGEFHDWTGKIVDIETVYAAGPRVTVELSGTLRMWATVLPGSAEFEAVKTMRSYDTPMMVSGRIVEDELASVRSKTDDIFPTCFEHALGITGCQINLTSIRVIH
jgi:hypothetical protein